MRTAALIAVAACAGLACAGPAQATQTGPGVRTGHNVMVFHTIDFVSPTGYTVGTPMTVDIVRNGHRIASVTANTFSTPAGGGLEINHGPAGAPQPGDCFVGFTPNISPGDVIRVTADGGTDEITVDNIRIDQGPVEQPNGDITLQGIAARFDGTPIDTAELNSGEVRNTSRFRGAPSEVVRTAGTADGWTAFYHPPYNVERNRNGLDEIGRKNAILLGSHAMGFGHLPVLPAETQIADGVGDTPGPALGCEAAPAAVNGIGTSSLDNVNADGLAAFPGASDIALTLGGPAAQEATSGTITLSDGTNSVAAPAEGLSGGASRAQGWTARFTKAQVEGLADATLTASATFATAAGDVIGASLTIVKDTVAPILTSSHAAGTYVGAQPVTLTAEGATSVTFSVDGAAPELFVGRPIQLGVGTHTLTAEAVDAAGNKTTAAWTYVIEPVAAPAAPVAPIEGQNAAPSPQVAVAAPAITSLPLSSLRVRAKLRRAEARRSGLRVGMTLAKGTKVVRLSMYRKLGGRHEELVGRVVRRPGRGGAYTVRLAGALRRSLTPGRYLLVATPGFSESRFSGGDERARAFRIVR